MVEGPTLQDLWTGSPYQQVQQTFCADTQGSREVYEESYKRVIFSGLTLDRKRVVLMGRLCADGDEHVATELLPIAEFGLVNADVLAPSSMVLAALKEAMEPDVGYLCSLLGDGRVNDDKYEDEGELIGGQSRQ
eukprot:4928257-Pleurochrysis_carterae.AAC.2